MLPDDGDKIPDGNLLSGTKVDRVGFVVPFGGEDNCPGRVLDIEELPGCCAGTPDFDNGFLLPDCIDKLLDQGRDHVGTLGIEIVARTVKVDWQEIDRIKPVLLPVRLCLHEERLLCNPVRGIGLFRVPVPELVLAKWYRSELGVGTDCSKNYALLHTLLPCCLNDLDAHDCVVIEEFPGIVLVEPDAADFCGKVDDDIPAFHCLDAVLPFPEVEVTAPGDIELIVADTLLLKLFNNMGAEKPGTTREKDLFIFPECHTIHSCSCSMIRDPGNPAPPVRRIFLFSQNVMLRNSPP